MKTRPLRLLAAALLLFDGLSAAFGVATATAGLAAHSPGVIAMVGLRALAGACEASGGWLLLQENPAATPIARVGVLLAACYATFGIGLRLAPTNLDPAFRQPVVVGYWAFALVVLGLLRTARRSRRAD